jgi:hypothetical protein
MSQNPVPSPFAAAANRLSRAHDAAFFSLLNAEKAIVRLVGPRRIGKTELVSHFARVERAPFLNVRIKPIPADIAPGPVVAALLCKEIDSLAHGAPKLYGAYQALLKKTIAPQTKRTFGAALKGGFASITAQSETSMAAKFFAPDTDVDVEISAMLRKIEQAAARAKLRPVIFFDEVQELVLSTDHAPGMATVWAIRNEIQAHTACRYVFAGSNQRLFSRLQAGRNAPLLNLGTAIEIQPLTIEEVDAWAVPLFSKGKRHINSLAPAARLLCGKIGEVVEVCNWLWAHSRAGDVLDETMQRNAVLAVARLQDPIDLAVRSLTAAQATVLRWILMLRRQPLRTRSDRRDGPQRRHGEQCDQGADGSRVDRAVCPQPLHGNHTAEAARHPVTGGVGRGIGEKACTNRQRYACAAHTPRESNVSLNSPFDVSSYGLARRLIDLRPLMVHRCGRRPRGVGQPLTSLVPCEKN